MSEEKIYELKRDIWTPSMYIRAGYKKPESEWRKIIGDFNIKFASDWFIDCSKFEEIKVDDLKYIVDGVFHRRGLHSLTYKEAAYEIAELWLKQNTNK